MINWHYSRTELANRYLAAFATGITGALALFAPRRMGKTVFLTLDLAPAAEAAGYQVAYCSFWNLQDNPAKSLKMALEEALSNASLKEKLSTYTENLSAEIQGHLPGATFRLKSGPSSSLISEDDQLAIIELLNRLAKRRKMTLLLLDEVQHLANDKYASLVATLRTQFEIHVDKIHVVFTGSSRDGLQRMFRDRKAPMFHAAQQIDFPNLDAGFVKHMLDAFEQASQHGLEMNKGLLIFRRLNHNPAMLHHLLRHMILNGVWDIEQGYEHFCDLINLDADYEMIWKQLKEADRAVLMLLAGNIQEGIYSQVSRDFVAEQLGVEDVSVKTVQNSIDRIRHQQLIYNKHQGEWLFEDEGFREWVRTHGG